MDLPSSLSREDNAVAAATTKAHLKTATMYNKGYTMQVESAGVQPATFQAWESKLGFNSGENDKCH